MRMFDRVCAMIVARQGFNAGQSVRELARLSGKSETTIRRWLKNTGVERW